MSSEKTEETFARITCFAFKSKMSDTVIETLGKLFDVNEIYLLLWKHTVDFIQGGW